MKSSLKHLKTFEEFKKDPTTLVQELFVQLKNKIADWFKTGTLSKEKNVVLEEIEVLTNSTQPFISFEFTSPEYYFEVILKGEIQNLSQEEEPKMFLLEIKKFLNETTELKNRIEMEVEEKDFTEDFLLQNIAKEE